jgi:short-subunit dehydrogenase
MKYKSVLITGAANGIGRELALQLSYQKPNLFLIDFDISDNLEIISNACRANGAQVLSLNLDVRNYANVRECLNEVLKDNLKIDLVIACAGYLSGSEEKSDGLFIGRICMETNYFGTVNIFEYFREFYDSNGIGSIKLVAITSISKLVSTQNSGFYSASKAALAAYLNALRSSISFNNISIHEIVLGFVKTNMTVNIPHAYRLGIEPQVASSLILKKIEDKYMRIHSIPRVRNLPWYVLSLLPRCFVDHLLKLLTKLMNRR